MSNIQVQFRRGTTTQHSSFTGAVGEVTVDTDLDTLRVHDGSTAGGVRLAKHSEIPTGGGGTVTQVDTGTGLTGGPITGTGTISIDAGGVGTTELAADAVTFAKMQDIDTAKVIGRTTAGSGDPEQVSILDDDTMAQASATSLATSESIKAYVDSQVSAGTVSKWDSGWVSQDDQTSPESVGNEATLVFDHDLGSAAVGSVFSVYGAEDSSGTNMEQQNFFYWQDTGGTNAPRGAQVKSITSTNITVQLAINAFTVSNAGGFSNKAWGTGTNSFSHIRVVLVG